MNVPLCAHNIEKNEMNIKEKLTGANASPFIGGRRQALTKEMGQKKKKVYKMNLSLSCLATLQNFCNNGMKNASWETTTVLERDHYWLLENQVFCSLCWFSFYFVSFVGPRGELETNKYAVCTFQSKNRKDVQNKGTQIHYGSEV